MLMMASRIPGEFTVPGRLKKTISEESSNLPAVSAPCRDRKSGRDRLSCRSFQTVRRKQPLEVFTLFHALRITGTQRLDTVLRVVTVHDRHLPAFDIMEITGKKHRQGGLADSALLVAQGDKDTSFAHTLFK